MTYTVVWMDEAEEKLADVFLALRQQGIDTAPMMRALERIDLGLVAFPKEFGDFRMILHKFTC